MTKEVKVSIDPGITHNAYAVWDVDGLRSVFTLQNKMPSMLERLRANIRRPVRLVLVEDQHVNKRSAVRADHILALGKWGSLAAGFLLPTDVQWVSVQSWKGQQPKAVGCLGVLRNMRGEDRLTLNHALLRECDMTIVDAEMRIKRHLTKRMPDSLKVATDLIDAVGIGLFTFTQEEDDD